MMVSKRPKSDYDVGEATNRIIDGELSYRIDFPKMTIAICLAAMVQ